MQRPTRASRIAFASAAQSIRKRDAVARVSLHATAIRPMRVQEERGTPVRGLSCEAVVARC
eukprot:629963-Pyramimonas_sp.AAC.1